MLWKVSQRRRLRSCGRGTRDVVRIYRQEVDGGHRATAHGLMMCGSVWSCPVCAAHIRHARSLDIEEGVRRHLAAGGGLLFLTLTLRHHRGERLHSLLDGLLLAQRSTFVGAPWKRAVERYGIVGRIRSTEATYGDANGWHPHLHLLLFLDRPITDEQTDDLGAWLSDRWAANVARRGLLLPSQERGCVLEAVSSGEDVGRYLAKVQETAVGLEMARGDLKSSRPDRLLPFDILEAAGTGEAWAVRLWHEYEAATHGRRCIEWSRGLRDRLGMGEDREDSEIVTEDSVDQETDELVGVIAPRDWHSVCRTGLDAALLDAAERAGTFGVDSVVALALERDGP